MRTLVRLPASRNTFQYPATVTAQAMDTSDLRETARDTVQQAIDTLRSRDLEWYGFTCVRFGLAVLFIWAGFLKLVPVSTPVRDLVAATLFFLPTVTVSMVVGFLEFSIGTSFLLDRQRLGAALLVPHQLATLAPFLIIPFQAFKEPWLQVGPATVPWVLDMEAVFILKNLAILGIGLVVLARTRDEPLVDRRGLVIIGCIGALLAIYSFAPATTLARDSGVFVTDYNNDDRPDVLALGGGDAVLFNNTGDGFSQSYALPRLQLDRTDDHLSIQPPQTTSSITAALGSMVSYTEPDERRYISALFFDHDNDGWEDLLLVPETGEPLFLENEAGGFVRRDVGLDARLEHGIGATTADYDHDGCLDLLILQHGDYPETPFRGFDRMNVSNDNGHPNMLYEGDCSSFDRATGAGITGDRWSLDASFLDLTGDGWPDIHVANEFNEDVLYINQQDGTFQRTELGRVTDRNGMTSTVMDADRDGRPDIFVTNIDQPVLPLPYWPFQYPTMDERYQGNNLLINQGNGTFTDRAAEYGLQDGGWGWAAAVTDFDNDRDSEVYQNRDRKAVDFTWSPPQRPIYWDRTSTGFEPRQVGFLAGDPKGAATLDADGDGDMDIISEQDADRLVLYENTLYGDQQQYDAFSAYREEKRSRSGVYDYGFRMHHVPVQLHRPGQAANGWLGVDVEVRNGTALGTRLQFTIDGTTRYRFIEARTSHRSQSTRTAHIGLGRASSVEQLTITTPQGRQRTLHDIAANQTITVQFPTDTDEKDGSATG